MAGHFASIPHERTHILLIPGFGGFDALGQVEYYAGITPLFQEWNPGKPPVVLRYFDNLPTAAVTTRAYRLRSYLAKRIARGEILEDDSVVLVGHSTGGLDIRQLIWSLNHAQSRTVQVDGGSEIGIETIHRTIRGVVFLSVPHWGTNIADWVRSHPVWRTAAVKDLRLAAAGSQWFPLNIIETGVLGGAASVSGADLLLAVRDAVTEADDAYGKPGPVRSAEAHEAAAELGLYLRHMDSDFSVINNLASQPPAHGPRSPAQYNKAERTRELNRWLYPTLSYATVSDSPFRFPEGSPAPVWDLTQPWTYPEVSKDCRLSAGTDLFYRLCYRACAGGPFRRPALGGKVTRTLDGAPPPPIELWDNDGIVNTASMLWPKGENVLVNCDHLDIVGHYKLVEAGPGGGRRYRSYDALRSAPPFAEDAFREVWTRIFDFAVCRATTRAVSAA